MTETKPRTTLETVSKIFSIIIPIIGYIGFVLAALSKLDRLPLEGRVQAIENTQSVLNTRLSNFPSEDYFTLKFTTLDTAIDDQKKATETLSKKIDYHIEKSVK